MAPITFSTLSIEDLADPRLGNLNDIIGQLVDKVNTVSGAFGTATLDGHLDLQGNRITNVGDPASDSDVLTASYASNTLGPSVVSKATSIIGTQVQQGFRRLNDPNQQENASSFLNGTGSIPPSANSSTVSVTASGTSSIVVVSAGTAPLGDGTLIPYAQRTDTVSNPVSRTIDTAANSGAVRLTNVITFKTTTAHGLGSGQFVNIAGVTDASFNGNFVVQAAPDSLHFTVNQLGPDATSGNGTAGLGSYYYYYLRVADRSLQRLGPFSADTPNNRLAANSDGRIFIAAARVDAAGGGAGSAGGGSTGTNPPPGCVERGTYIVYPDGAEVDAHEEPCSEWWEVYVVDSEIPLPCAPGTLVSVFVPVEELTWLNMTLANGAQLEGENGALLPLRKVCLTHRESVKIVSRVRPQRTYMANGIRLHNVKLAQSVGA